MDRSLNEKESTPSIPEPKLLRLPRSLAGALIGILVYVLILMILFLTKAQMLYLILFWPGTIASMYSDDYSLISMLAVSSIPFAVLGSFFTSRNQRTRIIGMVALILYLGLTMCFGVPMLVMLGDL